MQGNPLMSALRRDRQLYLLALPGIVFFLIFKYVPMWGIMISFQNYSPFLGFWNSEWVGLEHFQRFFSNPDFWLLFRNTMGINLLSLFLFFPLPIILALFLNEVRNRVLQEVDSNDRLYAALFVMGYYCGITLLHFVATRWS